MEFSLHTDSNGVLRLSNISDPTENSLYSVGELLVGMLNTDFSPIEVLLRNTDEMIELNDLLELIKNKCISTYKYPLNIMHFNLYSTIINYAIQENKALVSTLSEEINLVCNGVKYFSSYIDRLIAGDTQKNAIKMPLGSHVCKMSIFLGEVFETYDIDDLLNLLNFCFFQAIKHNIKINKCANCGLYFLPSSRSDEIYCDNIYKGNRTCKQVGYENKINSDEIMREYRKAYKTKNAFKNRNKQNNPNAEADFKKWVYKAKENLEKCRAGQMTLDEFKEWLNKYR